MITGRIPKLSTWCSCCISPEAYGNPPGPCNDHRGVEGEPIEYAGCDVYEPSAWVLDVIGAKYTSWRGVCECFGYDPRSGFWMHVVAPVNEFIDASERFCVSERAIDRTFKRMRYMDEEVQ